MRIIFVMGPACAGKSTFIKENFPEFKKIDLYDFQERWVTVENVMKSYEECLKALLDVIKNKEDVVLEHTFLKAIRRKAYIDAIKEITDTPIEAYFLFPSDEELKENAKQRGIKLNEKTIQLYREIAEFPTIEEGFAQVTLIRKNNK